MQLLHTIMCTHFRIDPDVSSVVYRAGIERGGVKEWEFLWSEFNKSKVASQKTRILRALGKTRDSVLIQR